MPLARDVEVVNTMRLALIAALLLTTTSAALAQPGLTAPSRLAVIPSPDEVAAHARYVDPQTAVLISLGGTAASYGVLALGATMEHGGRVVAIGALGTLLAPSFGRWYAGSPGLGGLGWRLVGAGIGVGGAALMFDNCFWETSCDETTPTALIVAGGVMYLGGTIYDIVHAGRDAEQHNEQLKLVPTLSPGDRRIGLALSGRF